MALESKIKRREFNPFSLDAVNFLAADVRGAVGPYLNVFLVTQQHWSQTDVGVVTTVSGLLGLAVQTPIGAAIDETRAKRGVIVLALAVLASASVVIFAFPTFWPVAIATSLMAVAGDNFLAGGDCHQLDGCRWRRLRSCGRVPDLGPVRPETLGAADGTEFGL
jgi:MFS family permease